MKYQVRLSNKAERDVDQALRWFHEQRAAAAGGRWYHRLLAKIETLETRPQRCRLAYEAAELGVELRELMFGRRRGTYRILFLIEGRTVRILRIRHTARETLQAEDL